MRHGQPIDFDREADLIDVDKNEALIRNAQNDSLHFREVYEIEMFLGQSHSAIRTLWAKSHSLSLN